MRKLIEHIRQSFSLIPKSLYKRFLLIIILPAILSQIFIAYVFYHRHWENVQTLMINTVADEISALVKILKYKNSEAFIDKLKNTYPINFHFSPKKMHHEEELLKDEDSSSIQMLEEELHLKIKEPFAFGFQDNKTVVGYIDLENGTIKVLFHKRRIENSSSIVFILWMFGLTIIFLVLALIFSRNQITPIIRLAKAMERFGKGRPIENFTLKGAEEVRQAGAAFLEMKDRIEKFVTQRTLMLAGVSHDLRTPLTRTKLQLAMMKGKQVEEIKQDIQEMEGMINSYLNFARDEESEDAIDFSIKELILETCETMNYKNLIKEYKIEDKTLHLKRHYFKRAIDNFIKNSSSFASRILIKGYGKDLHYFLELHDNGPGIPKEHYKDVLRPFFRIDKSRKSKNCEVGLGLAISNDLITRDGGTLELDKSPELGGLCVRIRFDI